jgi:hypothetical protein
LAVNSVAETGRLVDHAQRFHARPFFRLRFDGKPCEMKMAGWMRQLEHCRAAKAPMKFCRVRPAAGVGCQLADQGLGRRPSGGIQAAALRFAPSALDKEYPA